MVKKLKNSELQAKYDTIAEKCSTWSKRALQAAREKGASCWLNTLPLQKFGYALNKEEFRDSVCLRYSGKTSDLDHLLTCKLGGYVIMTHNHIRDTMANLLSEVCHDVKVEPQLQKVSEGDCLNPKTITGDQARLDISARGVGLHLIRPFLTSGFHTPIAYQTGQKLLKNYMKGTRTRRT